MRRSLVVLGKDGEHVGNAYLAGAGTCGDVYLLQEHPDDAEEAQFHPGVRHAGWLWKRFGHGHKATWQRLWAYLCDDRLCYHEPDSAALTGIDPVDGTGSSSRSRTTTARTMLSASREGSPELPLVGYYGTLGSTAASMAALAAGEVRYIALDRIPVRPLPHRQHELGPLERSHPDAGVTMLDDSVVGGKPAHIPSRATFSLVAGSHTYYFAAESPHEAELWVSEIRETWLHCFSHTARCTGGSAGTMAAVSTGVAVSQKLMAENALLRNSIQELNQQVTQANGEYWRKWVEEKAKNSVLESQLVNTATYQVVVRTGNVKGAATDARVYIELYGPDALLSTGRLGTQQATSLLPSSRGTCPVTAPAACAGTLGGAAGAGSCLAATADSSGEVRLFDADSTVKPFQRGATDSFTVACYNVGLPAKLKVWHDNTGRYPDWNLVDIKVQKAGTRDWINFPCNRWLSTEYEDGSISRVLTAGSSRPQVTYRVMAATSDLRGAGTDANVYLQLHGLLGDGLQHQLLGGANAFDRGAKDEFFLEDADLGELTAVTVSHDGSGASPGWHLDHIEVVPLPCAAPGSTPPCPTSQAANSPCGSITSSAHGPSSPDWADVQLHHQARRMSTGSPPFAARSSTQQLRKSSSRNASPVPFSQSRQGVNGAVYFFPCSAWLDEALGSGSTKRRLPVASGLEPKVWYTVHITTSDIRGAGTDADVHIALSGTQGNSGTVALPSRPEQYQRGQRDNFRLQLPPLGQLQKLLIGHNNKGQAPSWHVSVVEVVEEDTGHTTYFAADRWLGAQCGDGLSEVTLTASSTDPRKAQCEYQVCFLTSPCRGAGTDSCVSFELRGSKGSSGTIPVSAGHEAFQRAGSDTFTYTRPYLGQLQQLIVWHDNAGAACAGGRGPWCLESVVVSCKADQQSVTFPCGSWLSADTTLRVELLPGPPRGQTWYRFDIHTSDVRGAGTDAAVVLELSGLTGTPAGPWVLDRQGAFSRGQVDTFLIEGVEVYSPASLKVTLQGSRLSPTWHLDHIVCTVLESKDSSGGRQYFFAADRLFDWMADSTTAVLSASSTPPIKHKAQLQPYTIRVFTSGIRGAGTDANVAINVIGTSDSSDWKELPAQQNTFGQGQEDVFTIMLPDVGPLTHLGEGGSVSVGGSSSSSIGVRSDGSGQQASWHLEKVSVQPAASATASLQQQQQTMSPVWFRAQRWLDTAHGLEVLLPAQGDEPSTPSTQSLQAELQQSGGQQTAVRQEGHASPGQQDLILVKSPQGDDAFYVCRDWLSKCARSTPGTASPRLATALNSIERPLKDYTVVTYTSDVKGAGTDAGVYIELIDSTGASSERRQLVASGGDAFARCKVATFLLKCPALGSVAKLRIGHDGRGPKPAWHLSKVEVTDIEAGQTWFFAADCWLDALQGDGLTERLLLASDRDPWADRKTYKVTVVTSKRPVSGSAAAVFVTLYGSKGPPVTSSQQSKSNNTMSSNRSSTGQRAAGQDTSGGGRCELQASPRECVKGALLAPGSASSVMLQTMHGLGQLRQLLLEVEPGPDNQPALWHCQHVEVADTRTGEIWLFPCNAWLGCPDVELPAGAAPNNSCEPSKLLLPAPSLDRLLQQLQEEQLAEQRELYKFVVYTAADPAVQGCVSALVFTLTAASGATWGPVKLSKAPQVCCAAGGCEAFEVTAANKLGALQQLKVECELSAASASWALDTIAVTAQSTGITTWFYAGRWFDEAAGCEAVLQGSPRDLREQLLQYKVTTHTSDIEGAGTSSHVYMALSGHAGSSNAQELTHPSNIKYTRPSEQAPQSRDSSKRGFGRGEEASFMLSCATLGELQQLTVWHDSSGSHPAWHLAYVEVAELKSGKVWYFPCNAWLDSKRGDCATRRTVQATTSFSPDSLLMRYRTCITTGDVRGSGTDATVSLNIIGTLGETGPKRLLPTAPDGSVLAFDRASSRDATVTGFDVGGMTHVVVALDGCGLLSSWHLDHLEVEHLGTGQLLRFRANRWLDDRRPGCSLQYELWPDEGEDQESVQPDLCRWQLVIFTGSIPGGGTDADVYVELHGTSATFGPHMLPAATEAFQEGCRDTFSLETPDVGELLTLVISHNSKGRRPAWFLHGLELTHLPSNTVYSWTVTAWLNPQQGCSRTLRAAQAQRGKLQPPGAPSGSLGSSRACSYQLEVQTADVEGAGTSAGMFVQLEGALGEAEAVQLTTGSGDARGAAVCGQGSRALFQRGCLDVFILKGMPDVGPFTQLTIGHDGAGAHPGWCLAWVRTINLTTGVRALFAGNIWLDSSRPGCQNWAKLPAGPDRPVQPVTFQQQQQQQRPGQLGPQTCPVFGEDLKLLPAAGAGRFKGWLHSSKHAQPGYSIAFLTSNIWGAGTGSKVFFELIGEHGSTGVVYPTGPRSQFSRGCKASFLYPRLPYVGQLHQLRVGTDGSGLFAAWHVRQVEVTHVHSGQRWTFDCNQWLDRHNTWQLLLPAISLQETVV